MLRVRDHLLCQNDRIELSYNSLALRNRKAHRDGILQRRNVRLEAENIASVVSHYSRLESRWDCY